MCKFVEITLPQSTDKGAIRRLMDQYGRNLMDVKPFPNESWLPPGHSCFNTCAGHCDCSTQLGRLWEDEAKEGRLAEAASSLRKRGWSAAKVERWLLDKSRKIRRADGVHFNPEWELAAEEWSNLVKKLLNLTTCKSFGFALHECDEDVSYPAEKVPLSDVNAELMGRIRTNQLYLFTRYDLAS